MGKLEKVLLTKLLDLLLVTDHQAKDLGTEKLGALVSGGKKESREREVKKNTLIL